MNFEQSENEIIKIPETKIKEGVDFVFEQNPELVQMGTKEQYTEYLDTIFPESKVKEVVWHGTKGDWYKTDKFNTELSGTGSGNNSNTEGSIYFIKYHSAAKGFGDKKTIFPAVIDIKNPNTVPLNQFNQTWFNKEEYLKLKTGDGIIAYQEKTPEQYYNEALAKYEKELAACNKIESPTVWDYKLLNKPKSPGEFHEEQLSTTYVVFNPEQIHILGSQADIEKFKEFVDKNEYLS
jgi:ADP-Ribosyltransferase in polyvalent proteins